MHIFPGVKDKHREELTAAVEAALLPGEKPLALLAINRVRRPAELLAITDHRVLTFARRVGGDPVLVDDIDGASLTDVSVSPTSKTQGTVSVVTAAGKVGLGYVIRTASDELEHLDTLLRWLTTQAAPTEPMRVQRLQLKKEREAARGQVANELVQQTVTMRVSLGIKDKHREEFTAAVDASLLPGEKPLALLAINRVRRPVDLLAVTDHRVLTFARRAGAGPALVDDIDGASLTEVSVLPTTKTVGKASVVTATHKVSFGEIIRTAPEELEHLETVLRWIAARAQPTEPMRAQRQTQLAAQVGEREASLSTATTRERKELTKEFRAADDVTRLKDALIYGAVSKPLLRTIHEQCRNEDERPWLVLVGAGALVAFENRAVIIKTGAFTSFMAGSLGGGRVASFYFTDITGIEYNSGLQRGVLEILTASYQGSANKDFWRGSSMSRNADSNDPFTLSNTLPLDRSSYREALPGINELRDRIARAKETTVIVAGSPGATQAPSVTAELTRLAELHRAGVLSEEEFTTAKAALIARL